MVHSIDIWHGRLGHVNYSYIKKIKDFSLLSNFSDTEINKCEICTELKFIKKTCKSV